MKDTERQLLIELRLALLGLHKTLIEWERTGYERLHGRASSGELLKALTEDPHFAWLRPLSALIVRIDESLEIDALQGPEVDVPAILSLARTLTSPDENGTPHAQRYHTALQEHPDAVLAHRTVANLLRK